MVDNSLDRIKYAFAESIRLQKLTEEILHRKTETMQNTGTLKSSIFLASLHLIIHQHQKIHHQ